MICLLKNITENKNELFTFLNDILFLYVIENKNINMYKLITAITSLINTVDSIIIYINNNQLNDYNIFKISLLKNYFNSNKFSCIIVNV